MQKKFLISATILGFFVAAEMWFLLEVMFEVIVFKITYFDLGNLNWLVGNWIDVLIIPLYAFFETLVLTNSNRGRWMIKFTIVNLLLYAIGIYFVGRYTYWSWWPWCSPRGFLCPI